MKHEILGNKRKERGQAIHTRTGQRKLKEPMDSRLDLLNKWKSMEASNKQLITL